MRQFCYMPWLLTALVYIPNAASAQQSDFKEKVKQFWNRVANARSMVFTVQEFTWENASDIGTKPYLRIARTCEVIVEKPNRLAIRGTPPFEYEIKTDETGGLRHSFSGFGDNIQISDGKRNLLLYSHLHTYHYGEPVKSLPKTKDSPATGACF